MVNEVQNLETAVLPESYKDYLMTFSERLGSLIAEPLPKGDKDIDTFNLLLAFHNELVMSLYFFLNSEDVLDIKKVTDSTEVSKTLEIMQYFLADIISKKLQELLEVFIEQKGNIAETMRTIKFLGFVLYSMVGKELADDVASKLNLTLEPLNSLYTVTLSGTERVARIGDIEPIHIPVAS